jgi:CRISPR-associated exonuclease Cas4
MCRAEVYPEDELIPISALQHLVFCERQFALMFVERVWADNRFTVEGTELHAQVDAGGTEGRGEVRTARAVPLRSLTLGLTGRSDVVELRRDESGARVPGLGGRWRPYPIEYKRGRPKSHRADEVQLCAQALCLEEMLDVAVPLGALFYGLPRRRTEIAFDAELRQLVANAAERARALLQRRETPAARRDARCERCSLVELCQPDAGQKSARGYLARGVRVALAEDEGGEEA